MNDSIEALEQGDRDDYSCSGGEGDLRAASDDIMEYNEASRQKMESEGGPKETACEFNFGRDWERLLNLVNVYSIVSGIYFQSRQQILGSG
jgi:hypothetical protein